MEKCRKCGGLIGWRSGSDRRMISVDIGSGFAHKCRIENKAKELTQKLRHVLFDIPRRNYELPKKLYSDLKPETKEFIANFLGKSPQLSADSDSFSI